ncbi:GntR family transcriptional regulator [Cupriavidus oxalaticus]|jgi:DNA-binding GntR family transcriptional regulator|nr:GntR family transcriptional regulator [Cupriavidus oxalaticus]WQD85322.1 GntR family transcriptional regulator [Cupriavidus oxalaticus]SPC23302.1 Transcriptional regulator GntR family [Cupriavidus oxalaticus]
MTDASVPARSTLEYVVDSLRQAILSGRLVPGQRLVEADLTRELGVSRGPVRESFRRLSAEGLVESIPNQTTMVKRYSHLEMKELFEVRAALEALAAGRAARRMDEACVRERFLKATQPIWEDHHAMSPAAYFEENRRFHQAIADECGNAKLSDFIGRLQLPMLMFQLGNAIHGEALQESVNEHRLIAQAIVSGDADKSAQLMRDHLIRASEFIDRMPADTFRP